MAYHFSANQVNEAAVQFEDQYSPTKLGNWEYPKWYPERPRQRFKTTKIIADNNGYILEGIPKGNPWGSYVGTWDLPRRITREYAKQLVAPPEALVKRWEKKKAKTPPPPEEPAEENDEDNGERCKICGKLLSECTCKKPSETKSDEEETCEPLYCMKCKNEMCFCDENCRCPPYLPTIDRNTSGEKSFQKRNKSSSALDLRPRSTKLEPLVSLERKNGKTHNIEPGTLDEKIKSILDKVAPKEEKEVEYPEFICKEIKAIPRSSSRKLNTCEEPKGSDELMNGLDELEEEGKPNMEKSVKTPESKHSEPVKSGFQIAKRFHDENLKHKPLPDVIEDPVFKALYSGKQSNAVGDMSAAPTAIGWKPYSAPRPTDCSKLKVFRPKTGAEKQKLQKDSRPKTGDSAFKKRFLPIDLAICWDLKPDDPSDEPKRSPHIDGSNGSAAPAVFTMIRPTEPEEIDENVPGSSQALVERITRGIDDDNIATVPSLNEKMRSPLPIATNKEAILSCVKSDREGSQKQSGGTPESLNSISPNAAEYARRHPKTAWTKEDTSKALSDRLQYLQKENGLKKNSLIGSPPLESSQIGRKKHHQSTPNLAAVCDGSHCGTEKSSPGSQKSSEKNRNCENELNSENMSQGDKNSCEKNSKTGQKKRNCSACKKSTSDCNENREKTEFKAAFKAGVPRSNSTNSGSSAAKSYKVPKMRLPYAKRSYSIGTLAPPFSFWRESNGQEYPEHWRLASVYQHSYKPIGFRKRPLLASVYQ